MQDWAAVGAAITSRVRELGWHQHQLAQRSQVSQAVVRELQHHTVERRRSPRTLEALSIALGWHRRHLDAVLRGHTPPEPDGALSVTSNTLQSRLDGLDERLSEITRRLDELKTDVATVIKHIRSDRNPTTTSRAKASER